MTQTEVVAEDERAKLVKQRNKAVYTRDGNNISAVAVPTSAMEEGGTEYRLIIAVLSLLLAFSSPAIFFLYNAYQAVLAVSVEVADETIQQQQEIRLAASLIGLGLFFLPLFAFSRYKPGFFAAAFMTTRMCALPVLFALSAGEYWLAPGFYFIELCIFALRWACVNPKPSSDGKLRILFISDALPPKVDGVATFAMHMIRHFAERGHELAIVTSIPGPEEFSGVRVTRLPGMATKISPGHSITLPLFHLVFRVLASFKPDVIHLFEVSPLNLAMFYFCHLLNVPCTFSHHTRLDLYINIVTPLLPTFVNTQLLKTLEWGKSFRLPTHRPHLTHALR